MIRLTLALMLLSFSALAVEPGEQLADPALEARAREVSTQLRCVVCQNQNIDDSNADLARSMRLLVRERIKAGDSNDEVVQYLVDRYGDFVRLKPPLKGTTFFLWFGPLVFAIIALLGGFAIFRSRAKAKAAPEPLTDAELMHLDEMLEKDDDT